MVQHPLKLQWSQVAGQWAAAGLGTPAENRHSRQLGKDRKDQPIHRLQRNRIYSVHDKQKQTTAGLHRINKPAKEIKLKCQSKHYNTVSLY